MDLISALLVLAAVFLVRNWWHFYTNDHGAPFVAMSPDLVERVLELAQVTEKDVVYDLGSGDGRIPIMAALKYNAKAVGVEIDPLRILYSKTHSFILGLSGQTSFIKKDLFEVDVSKATVVVTYLNKKTNEALEVKLNKELKPKTRVVSAGFVFPNWKPLVVDHRYPTPWGPLYLYEFGKETKEIQTQTFQPQFSQIS